MGFDYKMNSTHITKIDQDRFQQFLVKTFTSIICKLMEKFEEKGHFPMSITICKDCFPQFTGLPGAC